MERIYTEATISKSLNSGTWETDENGNPIVIIEASNENLDYEDERVLKSALMDSKDYFLENGVISYDHKHLPSPENYKWDPKWTAEKYVIGQPLDAWIGDSETTGKPVVKVKAVLSKSNEIAKQIITKLKDGIKTVKASVGGRRVSKSNIMDKNTYRDIPTIVKVDWDEVALTYKPVNQTLGATVLKPKEFVKSLTAGSSANPGDMGSGGNTLQMQGIEKDPVQALFMKIRDKEISKSCDAISHLVNSGYSKERAREILKVMINKNYLGDVVMADEKNANDVIDTSTDELKKALESLEGGEETISKAKKYDDGKYKMQGGHMYKMKKGGGYEKTEDDSPDYNGDDDDDDMEKSLVPEEDFYDASADVVELKKSVEDLKTMNVDLVTMVKSMVERTEKQEVVLKAIGNSSMEEVKLLKSLSGAPQPRATTVKDINVIPRFDNPKEGEVPQMTAGSLAKSLAENEINGQISSEILVAHRHGGMPLVAQKYPTVLKQITKA